jgi:DNA-directed RNA polymerase specialized sigma24 family protein
MVGRIKTSLRENVEEIIHDTFMIIWALANEFRRESKASTWIMEIACRTAMRNLRRQGDVSSLRPVEGQHLLRVMRPETFRRWLFSGLMFLGAHSAIRGVSCHLPWFS